MTDNSKVSDLGPPNLDRLPLVQPGLAYAEHLPGQLAVQAAASEAVQVPLGRGQRQLSQSGRLPDTSGRFQLNAEVREVDEPELIGQTSGRHSAEDDETGRNDLHGVAEQRRRPRVVLQPGAVPAAVSGFDRGLGLERPQLVGGKVLE